MEGTVTISLKDYLSLKSDADRSNHYFEMAIKHIELLEEVEVFLTGEEIAVGLLKKLNEVLSQWYG